MGLPLAVVQAIQIVGAVTAVAGTVASISQGRRATRRQEAQNRRIKATNAAKATASRRRALREGRVRRAQLQAQAEAGGFSGSSTALAGLGLSATRTAEQFSTISGSLSNTNAISEGQQSIVDAQERQQLFSNVASIATSVFGVASNATETAAGEGLFSDD